MNTLIPTDQVAKALGVSDRRVRAMVTAGQLTPVTQGRPYYFDARAIERFAGQDRPPGRRPKPAKKSRKK